MHLGASSTQVIFQRQLSVTFKLHRAACLVTVASGSCPLPSPRAGTYGMDTTATNSHHCHSRSELSGHAIQESSDK